MRMRILFPALFISLLATVVTGQPADFESEKGVLATYDNETAPLHLVFDASIRMIARCNEKHGYKFALSVVQGALNYDPELDDAGGIVFLKRTDPRFVDQEEARQITDLLLREHRILLSKKQIRMRDILCRNKYWGLSQDAPFIALNSYDDAIESEATLSHVRTIQQMSEKTRENFTRWLVVQRNGFSSVKRDARNVFEYPEALNRISTMCEKDRGAQHD